MAAIRELPITHLAKLLCASLASSLSNWFWWRCQKFKTQILQPCRAVEARCLRKLNRRVWLTGIPLIRPLTPLKLPNSPKEGRSNHWVSRQSKQTTAGTGQGL